MKTSEIKRKIFLGLFATLFYCQFCPLSMFCQTEKLGIVRYTPVKGWTKTSKVENVLAFSTVDQATGRFCIITLYGATPGTGNAQGDFTREWKNLVIDPLSAPANPTTEKQAADGWTIIAGGSAVEIQGAKAVAFLTVLSGFGKTVSVLGVFNDEAYLNQLTGFVSGLDMDKTIAAPAQTVAAAPRTENGRLVIPMPTRQLTIADLAGEWGENAGITTTYVDRYTGTYAGFESLHFSSKMTITKNGEYFNDFFALQNGRKIKEKTSGSITVNGRVISIRQNNTAKYVVRGWLELPDMTILKVCGPWYNDGVIPAEIFTDPDQGSNLNSNWVRKK